MADIVTILIQSIQSVAAILIISGMLIAFLWKAAFYINLGLGLIITILVTYLVNVVSGDAGLTLGIFIAGLIGSIIVALIGGFLCLLEGFILSSLGFWASWVSGSPTSILSASTLVGSAFAGVISTGIAAYLGDYMISLGILKGRPSTQKNRTEEAVPVEIIPEDKNEKFLKRFESSLTNRRILGYVIAYRKVKLEMLASRYGLTRDEVEDILLIHLADGRIKGFIDPKTDTFIVET